MNVKPGWVYVSGGLAGILHPKNRKLEKIVHIERGEIMTVLGMHVDSTDEWLIMLHRDRIVFVIAVPSTFQLMTPVLSSLK